MRAMMEGKLRVGRKVWVKAGDGDVVGPFVVTDFDGERGLVWVRVPFDLPDAWTDMRSIASVGTPPRKRKPTKEKTVRCSVPICEEPAETGGMCGRHYNQRFFRTDGDAPGYVQHGFPCPVCNENLLNLSRHLSRHHSIRDLGEWCEEHGVKCSEQGCDKPAKVKGMCRTCYSRHLQRQIAARKRARTQNA